MPDWDLYRSFLAVMETGSLSRAARALRLSQPTVGRQVAALEASLGAALFSRSPGGLLATPAALALRPHAEAMAAAAAALVRAAAEGPKENGGMVRITASEIIGGVVLPPILADLRAAHPRLGLELALSNRNDDLLKREADIAVRMIRPTQGALHAKRIGVVEVCLHAAPSYVQRHGAPASLAAREGHTLIGFDRAPSYAGRAHTETPVTRDLFDLRSDSDLAQLALVQAGAGIGGVQAPLGRRLGLVPILRGAFTLPMEMWVATHEDIKAVRPVRLAFDALVEGLSAYLREPG